MRVSCLAFARILDASGRHCALLNAGRLKYNNERILSPVGGGLEYFTSGRRRLESLGAYDFDDRIKPELRFYVPDERVDAVERWFNAQCGREIGVLRELDEELRRETGVLSKEDINSAVMSGSHLATFTGETARDVPEKLTRYLIEVSNVTFPGPAMEKLLEASQFPASERWVYFLDEAEVAARATHDMSARVGDIMTTIVPPQ